MKKLISLFIAFIALAAFAIAPASAAPDANKQPQFSHPLVAAAKTDKAKPAVTAAKPGVKPAVAKTDKAKAKAGAKKPKVVKSKAKKLA